MKSHALHLNRSFSQDVTEAILVYQTITRRLCWCTKNFCRDWTNFACKFFLLLQEMIIVAEVKTIYQDFYPHWMVPVTFTRDPQPPTFSKTP